jgi:hypothetical protein
MVQGRDEFLPEGIMGARYNDMLEFLRLIRTVVASDPGGDSTDVDAMRLIERGDNMGITPCVSALLEMRGEVEYRLQTLEREFIERGGEPGELVLSDADYIALGRPDRWYGRAGLYVCVVPYDGFPTSYFPHVQPKKTRRKRGKK